MIIDLPNDLVNRSTIVNFDLVKKKTLQLDKLNLKLWLLRNNIINISLFKNIGSAKEALALSKLAIAY